MHAEGQWWSVTGLALVTLTVWPLAAASAAENAAGTAGLPNPFYAYCVGIGTDAESGTLKAHSNWPRCWQTWVTRMAASGSAERWSCSRHWRSTTRSSSRCTPISWWIPAIAATIRSSRAYSKAQRA